MYDYLLVGAGLFNAVLADRLTSNGKTCLVLEKRNHIGGNCYTYLDHDIVVHKYGAHIFRTNDREIWEYINKFAEFNNFVNSPIAIFKDEVYNLPFNMNTFSRMWGISKPDDAKRIIKEQSIAYDNPEANLETHAISLVGRDIYEKLIKGYTEKQWGKDCAELPASIIHRIPIRFTYDNNYYNSKYQGIPIGGFTPILTKMFSRSEIILNCDYLKNKEEYQNKAKRIIFTGTIDSYFNYKLGDLEYRSLKFETEYIAECDNFQGVAVVNYTDRFPDYTRTIEHKHFEFGQQKGTVLTKEYPVAWNRDIEPYYPINDEKNQRLYQKYHQESQKAENIIFGGRLGQYQYYDMQDTIKSAVLLFQKLQTEENT